MRSRPGTPSAGWSTGTPSRGRASSRHRRRSWLSTSPREDGGSRRARRSTEAPFRPSAAVPLSLEYAAPIVGRRARGGSPRTRLPVGHEEETVSGRTLRLVVPLLATLALVGSACGSNDNSNPPAAGGGGGNSSAPSFTTLKQGVLQVGSCLDYPPFEAVKNGKETGFDVELTDAIAKKLGLQVQWVKANFDTIFTAVAGHQFDMVAAAVTATGSVGAKRAQTVTFSDYYFNSLQGLTVNPTKTPSIASTDDLSSGDVVGV